MSSEVARPQLVAVTLFTILMLLAGTTEPSAFFNLRLSARQVGGALMPPGMIMTQESTAAAMLDMAAVDPHQVSESYTLAARGAQVLEPRVEDGIKVFDLTASVIRWQILPDPAATTADLKADHEYTIQLQEWLVRDGLTYPAMPMEGGMPNLFTINGRAYPSTDTIKMQVGETLKIRLIGSSSGFIHPMHVHGGPFTGVARDGETLAPAARYQADTVNVGPGQRYVYRA